MTVMTVERVGWLDLVLGQEWDTRTIAGDDAGLEAKEP
jgi:hypothetical protein